MKKRMKNGQLVMIAAVLLLAVILIPVGNKRNSGKNSQTVSEGIGYLESLEQKDPAAVDAVRHSIRQEQLAAQREELLRKLDSGEIDPFTLFQDFVIMGDSRILHMYNESMLERRRVLAEGGDTIRDILQSYRQIQAVNPSYIFLCYGLNDVSIGNWSKPDAYAEEYMQTIAQLQSLFPEAKIIVSSILPARDPAFKKSSSWRKIPEFSAALEAACRENGITFVNNDKISQEHADLWDPDGIHLRTEFYTYWMRNLIKAALEDTTHEGK